MLALATIVKIRVDHFQDRVLIAAIRWKRRVSRSTVRKAVREGPEAFVSASEHQPKPGPWITELERMINAVGFISRSGQIVDLSLVAAPRRRKAAGRSDRYRQRRARGADRHGLPFRAKRSPARGERHGEPHPPDEAADPSHERAGREGQRAQIGCSDKGRTRLHPPEESPDRQPPH